MKPSIRLKLFWMISCLILFFVMFSWLMNSFVMDKYYLYSKKKALSDTYKRIDSIYDGNPENIALELETIENIKGLGIVIIDQDLEVKYTNNQRAFDGPAKKSGRNGPSDEGDIKNFLERSNVEQLKNGQFLIETIKDPRLNINMIRLFSVLRNGDYILLSTPVAMIHESVKIANKFFLFTGVFTILAGLIMVLIISGKFTRPILELNSITKDMSRLDFARRYKVKTDDEIGQLGNSINSLSEQLETSINSLKEANKKLMEDIEKERKIDEMRKYFISSVSHELKTPIALIQGYAEGLKVNVNEDEENKNFYCDIITDEALKMNKLVKQLLELSQLESGMASPEKAEFDVSELVEILIRKNYVISKEQGIDVSYEKGQEYIVNTDFDRAEQVLTNYFNNAVNHIDEKKLIKISIMKREDKIRISVFNSGKQIPQESLDKIWTSFYKVDKARTRAYGGFGLGLSIVRAIQEADGNAYGVENTEGGVTFWFELDGVEK